MSNPADHTPLLLPEGAATETDDPTFPPEAESLLQHLKLGAARSAAVAGGTPVSTPAYDILDELGRGGMGIVYKARQRGLNRIVALKMIQTSAHAAPAEVTRFLAEAEAIAAVEHPNVVQVYEVGEADGRPYFAMEYVGGGSLASLLKSHGRLDPRRAAELIESVAYGVQAAHDAGIVHRDLKPGNILIADCGSRNAESKTDGTCVAPLESAIHNPQSAILPKVSDFGLAKRLAADLTRSQAVMGTPAYMAPEQAGKAKYVGPGADVYAMGAVLYECLTGRPPFEGDAWSVIRQVCDEVPEPPRKLAPAVPRDLELICLKCLEKVPHDRYPTAAALAADLRRYLNGEPVTVRPIGCFTRAARCARRRPAAAALIALVLVLAVAGPPVVVWEQARLDRREAVATEARAKEAASAQAAAQAENARRAAEELAAARELFAIQARLRTRAAARPVGWTHATLHDLPRTISLAAGDPGAVVELRSAAADALLAADLHAESPLMRGFDTAAAATDPKTGLVAFGEFQTWALGSCRVRLVDPATGRVARELTFPAGIVRTPKGQVRLTQDSVRSLAFSPDGTRLFVGTRSSRVIQFDLDKPENTPAKAWNASISAVEQLALSPDGKTVYGLCRPDAPVFAWEAATGKLVAKLTPEEGQGFRAFAVLPSGDVIAGHGHRVHQWNASHKPVRTVDRSLGLRLTPTDGSMLLWADGMRLNVYDADTLEPMSGFTDPGLRRAAHTESVRSAVIHPSRAYVVTASGDRGRTVRVWELASGRLIGAVTVPGIGPIAVAWSGDGRYLLAASNEQVSRWRFTFPSAATVACIAGRELETAVFLADGSVAALSERRGGNREFVYGPAGGRATSAAVSVGGHTAAAVWPGLSGGPDGRLAATFDVPGVLMWKPGTPVPEPGLSKCAARFPRFARDGATLWAVVNSCEVHALDSTTRQARGKWSNAAADLISGLASLESLAAGASLAAAGCVNGSVTVLDTSAKPVASFSRGGDPVLSVAVAPDDAVVVAGTQKGYLRVMDPAAKTELPAEMAHPGGVTTVTISRDGMLLATGGHDRTVRLWRRSGARFELVLSVSNLPGRVEELEFSPTDGRLLVLLAHEHAVRVWDTDRLKGQLAELKLGW